MPYINRLLLIFNYLRLASFLSDEIIEEFKLNINPKDCRFGRC